MCAPKAQLVPALEQQRLRRQQEGAEPLPSAWWVLAGRAGGRGRSPVAAAPRLLCLGCRDTFQAPSCGCGANSTLSLGDGGSNTQTVHLFCPGLAVDEAWQGRGVCCTARCCFLALQPAACSAVWAVSPSAAEREILQG